MDEALSAAAGGAARALVLAEPTCNALGLPPSQPTPRSEVAAGALRLLDPVPASELVESFTESLDELIVGVVEAVEECVLTPDCADPRLRAEVEAVSWVDDFIADDAPQDEAVVAQQAMLQLACLVAEAVADALTARTSAGGSPSKRRFVRVETLDLRRVVDELRRRGLEVVRWRVHVATPFRWLHR